MEVQLFTLWCQEFIEGVETITKRDAIIKGLYSNEELSSFSDDEIRLGKSFFDVLRNHPELVEQAAPLYYQHLQATMDFLDKPTIQRTLQRSTSDHPSSDDDDSDNDKMPSSESSESESEPESSSSDEYESSSSVDDIYPEPPMLCEENCTWRLLALSVGTFLVGAWLGSYDALGLTLPGTKINEQD